MYMYMWAGKESPSQTSAKRAHTDYDQLVHVIGCNSGIDITQVKFPQSNIAITNVATYCILSYINIII